MYRCECGKEFEKPNSFNGHKSHCLIHAKAVGKYDYLIEVQQKRNKSHLKTGEIIRTKNKIISEENKKIADLKFFEEIHYCEACGKLMTDKYASGRFCSRSCANSRKKTNEVKQKVSSTISANPKWEILKNNYFLNPNYCVVCNKVLDYSIRNRKTCSEECLAIRNSISAHKAGMISASKRVLRSKNEIYFCELCEKYFSSVRHNESIFNGWDADIIIDDIKYAVLWNGPWHYHQLVKNQSLEQIQNRDRIKVDEIKKYGYTPYIIKDEGEYNPEFVEKQFNLFIESL